MLEAGPRDNYLWIHIPIGYGKTMFHPVYNWGFHTEPQPEMNGRKIYWPRGRGLGGSSSINGLIISGPTPGLRCLGRRRQQRMGVARRPAVFHPQRRQSARRQRYAWRKWPLACSDIGAQHELIEAIIAERASLVCHEPTISMGARRKASATSNFSRRTACAAVRRSAICAPPSHARTSPLGWRAGDARAVRRQTRDRRRIPAGRQNEARVGNA